MRILITGSTGFVGKHLVAALKSHDVAGFDKSNGDDVTDFNAIMTRVANFKPDVIVHLAAQAIVGSAEQSPMDTFETNIMGTANVLEIARKEGIRIVIVSTDKVYGYQPSMLPYTENTYLEPVGTYDTSKACADLLAQNYIRVYKAPVIIVRPCNIYGYDRNLSRLIPEIVTKGLRNERILLRSDGTQVREYIFIDDLIDAYVKLIEGFDTHKGQIFNIGSGDSMSVIEVILTAGRVLGRELGYDILSTARNEIQAQYLDSSKFMGALGWKPGHSFEEGLRLTKKRYEVEKI